MAFHARYHQQDTDELSANHRIVFIHPMDKTILCGIPCLVLPWDKGREGRENYMAKDLDGAFLRLRLFLYQLVAAGIAHRQGRGSFALHLHAFRWLYLPADGWRMGEPTIEE